MKITGSERETLSVIASCPFVDRLELAAISGASRSAVYETVRGLEDAGLVAHVPHAADLIPPTRRYRLTAKGLGALAGTEGSTPVSSPVLDPDRGTGQALDGLLRSRPVSIQWLRILMDRLDALAVIYRLVSTIAGVAHPVGLRLYRAGPLDAAMTLPGGRTVGIARQGHAADRTGFSRRLWKLRDAPHPGTVLVLVTDEVRLRHARKMLPRTVEALLALERDAALAGPEDEVWRPAASGPPADLRNALGQLAPGGELPVEAHPSQADLTRRRRPGRRPRSARPSQTRREARPRPDLRLALAAPHGAGEPDGRLRAPRVPARQRPRRVRPRDPAHRRERTNRPHRPGRGAPGP